MTTHSEFIARVRAGLDSARSANSTIPAPPETDDHLVRLKHSGLDLADAFAARASITGMVVHRCTPSTLAQTLQPLLASLASKRIILDHLDPPLARPVSDALAQSAAEVFNPHTTKNLDPQFDAAAGITGVLAGIAETGTLVVASDAKRSRGTFIIPPIHIALVHESQIIPDMLDLWPLLGATPPTAMTLITGPSKTADIEGILVTGVHGPGAVHIILLAAEHQSSGAHKS